MYGCSSTAVITMINDKNSNPNYHGDNVPVTLKLYKLNGVERFKEASVLYLNTREDAVLGKDMIDVSRMQIAPNDAKVMATIKKKDVGYICTVVRSFCGTYFHIGEGRDRRSQFQSGNSHPDRSCRHNGMGDGIPDPCAERHFRDQQKKLAVPDPVGAGNGRIVAVLLPGTAVGRGVESGAD